MCTYAIGGDGLECCTLHTRTHTHWPRGVRAQATPNGLFDPVVFKFSPQVCMYIREVGVVAEFLGRFTSVCFNFPPFVV